MTTVIGNVKEFNNVGEFTSGKITFTPSVPYAMLSENTLLQTTKIVEVGEDGAFSVELTSGNNPNVRPSGFTYRVVLAGFQLVSGVSRAFRLELDIDVPHKTLPVNFNDCIVGEVNYGAFETLHYNERIKTLELLGGLAPGDVSDATVKALVDDPDSLTGDAMRSLISSTTSETVEEAVAGKANKGFGISIERAYRRRIVHNLVYEHADAAAARAAFSGSLFPQTFAVDEEADELLTISANPQIVSVYSWSTGEYKGQVYSLGRAGVTEGAVIRREGNRRFLYVVGALGSVDRFDITEHPARLSTISPQRSYSVDAFNRLTFFGGRFTTGTLMADSGGTDAKWRTRGRLTRFDEEFNPIGLVDLPASMAGLNGPYQSAVYPKMQGIAEGPGFFALGIGGGWAAGSPETDYHLQGIRVFTPAGEPVVDALIPASIMRARLMENGVKAEHIENEGVAWVGGKLLSLYPVLSSSEPDAKLGGILIMEEFSDADDAIDFSDGARPVTVPDVKRLQSGLHPLAEGNKLRDLVTWGELTTLQQIFEYMRNVGQYRFTFPTAPTSVKDPAGDNLPNGYICEVLNVDNSTFIVNLSRNSTTGAVYTLVGANWVLQPRTDWTDLTVAAPYKALTGSTDRNGVALDGNFGVLKLAFGPASGSQIPSGDGTVIANAGIPKRFRPSEPHNLLLPGHSSGSAVRVIVGTGGDVRVIGVPGSTHNYIAGTVSYPL